MFWWLFGKKKVDNLEKDTKKGFISVKKDIDGVGKWIKHLHGSDKQLFDLLSDIKREMATVKDDFESLKEAVSYMNLADEHKQLSKKLPVYNKQTAVESVYTSVQTPVQTGNIHDILQGFSSNERLLVYTLINTQDGMKLSYEDLARLLGKERSTIRGQINSIKQKSEGLLNEIVESNGKKRVFIGGEIKDKMSKYAKVRTGKKKGKSDKNE